MLPQRSVHELSEEEQMRLAMEASLGDHPQTAAAPIVIDDEEEDVQILESLPLATSMFIFQMLHLHSHRHNSL